MAIVAASPKTPLALDNDVFTDWRKHRQGVGLAIKDYKARFKEFPKLTSITVFEARWGFESQVVKFGGLDPETEQMRSEMEELIQTCGVLDFDQHAASIAAHIFARLSQSHRNRHWRDILIAATALAHGYGVATRNKDDFELIGRDLPDLSPTLYLAIWKP
ncbi:MAG: type II toxin-antitoxin system VapC family toxin [Blastocatellia bacterium]